MSEIKVRLTSLEILGIDVPAPKGWPSKKALSVVGVLRAIVLILYGIGSAFESALQGADYG